MSISWRQQSSTSGNRCCPSDWSYDGIAGLGYRREGKRDRTLLAEQGIFVESGENCVCHAKIVSQEVRVIHSKFLFSSHLTPRRSEEHTSELQSLMRISYAVFCLKKKNI